MRKCVRLTIPTASSKLILPYNCGAKRQGFDTADRIYSLAEDGRFESMDKEPYEREYDLQSLLEKHPDLLAGDQIDELNPRRWLHVSREVGVPEDDGGSDRWYLDHLFLDQDAIPTLVEVKQSNNNDTRRKVVGQMLDYAANSVAYWPVESLRDAFEASANEAGEDPTQLILSLIRATPEDIDPVDKFWTQVKTNLQAGRIRLLFVADEIPKELQQIVEFLNGQMSSAEVLAVEVRQYKGEKSKTLVPRVIGLTAVAAARKTAQNDGGKWDESSFFQELKSRSNSEGTEAARRILAWTTQSADRIWWGNGKQRGSFTPIIENKGTSHYLFAVWTSGVIETYFYYLKNKPPFDSEDLRKELLAKLNEVPGINLPSDAIDRGPSIPLSALNGDALMKFLQVFDWAIERIRTAT